MKDSTKISRREKKMAKADKAIAENMAIAKQAIAEKDAFAMTKAAWNVYRLTLPIYGERVADMMYYTIYEAFARR